MINSAISPIDEEAILGEAIAKLCARPFEDNESSAQYRLSEKVILYGKLAKCVIEVNNRKVKSMGFVFELSSFSNQAFLNQRSLIYVKIVRDKGARFHQPTTTESIISTKWSNLSVAFELGQQNRGSISQEMVFNFSQEPLNLTY